MFSNKTANFSKFWLHPFCRDSVNWRKVVFFLLLDVAEEAKRKKKTKKKKKKKMKNEEEGEVE